MDHLTIDDLRNLMEEREGPHCSILLPVRKGAGAPKTQIRLKNQLNTLENKLQHNGLNGEQIDRMLAPAYDLMRDDDFWTSPGNGLALFMTPGEFHAYMLPHECREMAMVGSSFSIKCAIPSLVSDGQFYILAVSQNEVRLLEASHHSARRIRLADVPSSMREMLAFLEVHDGLRWHMGTNTPGRSRQGLEPGGMMFTGHGAGDEENEKVRIAEFLNEIDKGVRRLIDDGTHAPLVIAGVEYLHPIYREQSDYSNLIEGRLTGNFEHVSDSELHRRAWEIVEPLFRQELERAKDRYQMHAGREDGLAVQALEDVVPAAYFQRVETLFYDPNQDRWGSFNAETGEVELHDAMNEHSVDLVDLAVRHALLNGGEVYAVAPEDMPGDHVAAAVLRF